MHVTLIGTGNMARGLGSRVLAGGHDLTVVGKDEQRAEAVAADLGGQGRVGTAVDGDPIEGEVVVLAVYYPDARAAVEQYADQFAGKVVVDITNPVNATFDGLVVPPDGSATNELAGLAPDARFVKAFNTTFAGPLTQGEVDGQTLDVLIAGDDEDAKAQVAALARDGGLKPIDVGPQARARELEAMGLLHMGVQNTLGTGFASALKIVG
ncbi:MAG: NADPH-dependent F420 reductase [Solirubrobacteraceae bacterium]